MTEPVAVGGEMALAGTAADVTAREKSMALDGGRGGGGWDQWPFSQLRMS